MYLTDLDKTEEVDITPEDLKGKGQATVRWLLGEPQGAPNFEMRYFALKGDISTEWHQHKWEHQVYVISGIGMLRTVGGEFDLFPGNSVLVEPGEHHNFTCKGEHFDFICIVPKGTRSCTIK